MIFILIPIVAMAQGALVIFKSTSDVFFFSYAIYNMSSLNSYRCNIKKLVKMIKTWTFCLVLSKL